MPIKRLISLLTLLNLLLGDTGTSLGINLLDQVLLEPVQCPRILVNQTVLVEVLLNLRELQHHLSEVLLVHQIQYIIFKHAELVQCRIVVQFRCQLLVVKLGGCILHLDLQLTNLLKHFLELLDHLIQCIHLAHSVNLFHRIEIA